MPNLMGCARKVQQWLLLEQLLHLLFLPLPTVGNGVWGRHWHFLAPGDTFLGCILAGFDPNKSEFATPPPHWKVADPLENKFIKEAMQLMFGPIPQTWGGNVKVNPTSFLVCFLASMVHCSNWLKQWVVKHPGHPFSHTPLMLQPDLLEKLKELVTTELAVMCSP